MATKAKRRVTLTCCWKRCGKTYQGTNNAARGFCSSRCRMAYSRFRAKWLNDLEAERITWGITPSADGSGVYVNPQFTAAGWKMLEGLAAASGGQDVKEMLHEMIADSMRGL